MTDYRDSLPFRFLTWTIGLILVWLSVEAFSLVFAAENQTFFRFLHVFLVLSLVILGIISIKVWGSAMASHSRELEEMRRTVESTALRYKSLLEDAGDAIFVINAETGHLEIMNEMGTVLLGYSREEMGALTGKDLISKSDQSEFISLVRRVNRHGMASAESLSFMRKDGSQFLGEVNARLIILGDGKVVQAIIRDITQKKTAEQEIRKRNRKLSILNSIIARANASLDLQHVLDVTLKETMEVFAAGGGSIHLLKEDDVLTLVAEKNLPDRLIAAARQMNITIDAACRIKATRQCCSLSDTSRAGCIMSWHSREEGWQSIAGIPLFARDTLIGVMHIMSHDERRYTPDDINFFTTMGNQIGIMLEHARLFAELNWKSDELLRSHQFLEKNSRQLALSEKRLRKNLALVESANIELARVDRMKNHFLGMISHEFKTPLTAIICSSDFLMAYSGREMADDERRLLDIIHKGGERLNQIISDLLKVARIDANASPVCKTTMNIEKMLDDLLQQFAPLLHSRSQRLAFQGIDALPDFSGDRECLYDIFTRLLENAVKFTPDGGDIVIAAEVTNRQILEGKREKLSPFNPSFCEQAGNDVFLQVEFRDSGVGIPPEERHNIFDVFYELGDIRHHTSGREKFLGKGAGLGLAIVKGMIEAHGGMVWVESPVFDSADRPGSSFFVLVPLAAGPSQTVFSFMQAEPPSIAQGFTDLADDESDEPA